MDSDRGPGRGHGVAIHEWRMVGVVTGLQAEADILAIIPEAVRPPVVCAGAQAQQAASAVRRLVAGGVHGVVSFGLAGGLDPALDAGDLLLADGVISPSGAVYEPDRGWLCRLQQDLPRDMRVAVGAIVGVEQAVTTVAAKSVLAATAGARAADMESHAVAAAAVDLGVPFLVVRAICDGAHRPVPAWLGGVIDGDGRPQRAAILWGVATRPQDLLTLLVLAGDARRAFRSLRRFALAVGPLFGFEGGR